MILPEDFFLPFEGTLNKDNRWVRLAQLIPWWKVEEHYAATFKKATAKGTRPFSARLALGALIIQQRQGTSDRETVQEIMENAYMQYFLGLPGFQQRPPFHHSMMARFRKRLKKRDIDQINEWLIQSDQPDDQQRPRDSHHQDPKPPRDSEKGAEKAGSSDGTKHQGKLLLDATCTPADIAYPTDLSLLNQAREKLEQMIDELYEPIRKRWQRKPRTYRRKAHRAYLAVAKQRRPGAARRRKALGRQLRFVKRDLRILKKLSAQSSLTPLPLPAGHSRTVPSAGRDVPPAQASD